MCSFLKNGAKIFPYPASLKWIVATCIHWVYFPNTNTRKTKSRLRVSWLNAEESSRLENTDFKRLAARCQLTTGHFRYELKRHQWARARSPECKETGEVRERAPSPCLNVEWCWSTVSNLLSHRPPPPPWLPNNRDFHPENTIKGILRQPQMSHTRAHTHTHGEIKAGKSTQSPSDPAGNCTRPASKAAPCTWRDFFFFPLTSLAFARAQQMQLTNGREKRIDAHNETLV